MKKVLKTIFIILIIAGAVGTACYFFFANLKKGQDVFASVNSFIYSSEQTEFASDLNFVKDNGGSRFELFIKLDDNLQGIALTLNPYLLNNEDIKEGALIKSITTLKNKRLGIQALVSEYKDKCTSIGYKKVPGANDLYIKYVEYFTSYINFLLDTNAEVVKVVEEPQADVKFSVIDLYLQVASNDLQSVDTTGMVVSLNKHENLDAINTYFKLEKGYLKVNVASGSFGVDCSNFVDAYEKCDKVKLARQLNEKMAQATTTSNVTDKELLAAFYFKKLY